MSLATRATEGPARLAAAARAAIDFLTGPRAGKLSLCPAPGCIQFLRRDSTRREWCGTACGNRVRAARNYERRTG